MPALHERLHFDTVNGQVLDADRRYLLLRADVLMGLFDGLAGPARDDALRAFGRSVASRGSASVRAYAASAGTDDLPAMMESAAASLGWGRWRLQRAEGDSNTLALDVDNSPFAAASHTAAPACHAIAGMLEALAGVLWNGAASAAETHCAAEHGGARCRFIARPLQARSPDPLPPVAVTNPPADPGLTRRTIP